MKFIFGLGNPGIKYQETRHNIGFNILDVLADDLNSDVKFANNKKLSSEIIKNSDLILGKPQAFMNDSGRAVRAVMDYYDDIDFNNKNLELKNLFIIHDDLDLELGKYKIDFGKGPKVHNGLLSIYDHLGTDQFWHVRVGVDARGGSRVISGSDYVLGKFTPLEKKIILETSNKIITDLKQLI